MSDELERYRKALREIKAYTDKNGAWKGATVFGATLHVHEIADRVRRDSPCPRDRC